MTEKYYRKKLGPKLLNACYFGNKSLAIKLIKEGADPFYIDSRDGWSGIHYAARWGILPIIRALIASGVSVNMLTTGKETPLHKACRTNRVNVCCWLLKNGADPNILNGSKQRPSDLTLSKEIRFICDHFEEYCKIIEGQKNNVKKENNITSSHQ